jgi:hypothetical protein
MLMPTPDPSLKGRGEICEKWVREKRPHPFFAFFLTLRTPRRVFTTEFTENTERRIG